MSRHAFDVCMSLCVHELVSATTHSHFEGSVALHSLWNPVQNLAGSRGQDEPEQQWHGLRASKASGWLCVAVPACITCSPVRPFSSNSALLHAVDGNSIDFVNLYDRELPGHNRNKLEHGLWQSSWYTNLSSPDVDCTLSC